MSSNKVKLLKTIGLWALTVSIGGLFLMSGAMKVSGLKEAADMMAQHGYPPWFLYFIGAAEVLAAALLFVPRFSSLGALALGGIMIGATVTHLVHGEWAGTAFTLLLFGLLVVIGYARRHAVLERFGIRRFPHTERS